MYEREQFWYNLPFDLDGSLLKQLMNGPHAVFVIYEKKK